MANQDAVLAINKLRASYLSIMGGDQTYRIIKPYHADGLEELYNHNGQNLLQPLESPPVAFNYIDDVKVTPGASNARLASKETSLSAPSSPEPIVATRDTPRVPLAMTRLFTSHNMSRDSLGSGATSVDSDDLDDDVIDEEEVTDGEDEGESAPAVDTLESYDARSVSSVSSFGHSLLDSEPDVTDLVDSQGIPNNSVPSAYDFADDSILQDAFDRAVLQIKFMPARSRRRSSNANLASGISSLTMSSVNVASAKRPKKKHHQRRRTGSSSSFVAERQEVVVAEPKVSALSSMFRRSETLASPLEYFSPFGGTIPLRVYVQSVPEYRHKPLELSVSESATVFDAIGYILLSCKLAKEHPNWYQLKIVDEDGEPFEGNFGLLDRTKQLKGQADDEVVLCRCSEAEFKQNEHATPLPYKVGTPSDSTGLNQFSYYKTMVVDGETPRDNDNTVKVKVKVYPYPILDHEFNFTLVTVAVSSKVNEILLSYCRMKNQDPNNFSLCSNDEMLDLNDLVSSLDGNYDLGIISKFKLRELRLPKRRADENVLLPTINSGLTPKNLQVIDESVNKEVSTQGSQHLKPPVPMAKQSSFTRIRSNSSQQKVKNIYSDPLTSDYYKFTVWRRQPMSFMNKQDRTLAIDGDYIYIIPNTDHTTIGGTSMHGHHKLEHKTTSFHISQVVSIKPSKKVASHFKINITKPNGLKRYYLEAVDADECKVIVKKLTDLLNAYRVNKSHA